MDTVEVDVVVVRNVQHALVAHGNAPKVARRAAVVMNHPHDDRWLATNRKGAWPWMCTIHATASQQQRGERRGMPGCQRGGRVDCAPSPSCLPPLSSSA